MRGCPATTKGAWRREFRESLHTGLQSPQHCASGRLAMCVLEGWNTQVARFRFAVKTLSYCTFPEVEGRERGSLFGESFFVRTPEAARDRSCAARCNRGCSEGYAFGAFPDSSFPAESPFSTMTLALASGLSPATVRQSGVASTSTQGAGCSFACLARFYEDPHPFRPDTLSVSQGAVLLPAASAPSDSLDDRARHRPDHATCKPLALPPCTRSAHRISYELNSCLGCLLKMFITLGRLLVNDLRPSVEGAFGPACFTSSPQGRLAAPFPRSGSARWRKKGAYQLLR